MGSRFSCCPQLVNLSDSRYTRAVFLIGLTGGIAAGKSTVSRRFAELGAIVLNADEIARDAVAPGTPALSQIVARFGSEILQPDGALDRARLGSIVFGKPELLQDLNAIVHPAVFQHTKQRLEQIELATPNAIVVYDVPLLIEANVTHDWDMVVVVMADAGTRQQRLMSQRGMSVEEAAGRIAAQASDEERLRVADRIIDSSGLLEHTLEQTDVLWGEILGRALAKAEA